uniref:Protein SCAI n=1 Tax=Cacopsylla melanoneura TaxID=428564 RepID=A0A8D8SC46_9HEMI
MGMDDHERAIVIEFCKLLEKSKQLFNALRDLPSQGFNKKQLESYFSRTFDVYTRLWKFQQQHRQVLDQKYGLKRWQIGEIASKIGQLYYHYYLRTSETKYLNEAYAFYLAIRSRAYYSRAAKEDRSDLMVKQLRYYARFIVVCLLLRKMQLVRELVMELDKHIVDYTTTYEPDDQMEWSLVLEEIKSFVKGDCIVNVLHADSNPICLSHRLSPLTTPPVEKSTMMNLSLQEVVVIGNSCNQVKFNELSMDMYRIAQTLEREFNEDAGPYVGVGPGGDRTGAAGVGPPGVGGPHFNCSPAPARAPFEKSYSLSSTKGCSGYPVVSGCQENGGQERHHFYRKENPHKHILYKPVFSHIINFISAGFRELLANGALMIYLSADGCFSSSKHQNDVGYDFGGIVTASHKKEPDIPNKKGSHIKESHCLYPGDLYPFTRKPLFLIVDSDNSFVFQNLPPYFGQPLIILMSPQDLPSIFHDQRHYGNLFTLFLHSPLTAFCYICNVLSVPIHHWERCQSYIDRFVTEASRLLTRSRIDPAYLQFFGDDFLRLLLLRYVFCDVVLHLHQAFKGRQYRPKCQPPLPDQDLLEHPSLQHLVLDLAAHLEVRKHFHQIQSDVQ